MFDEMAPNVGQVIWSAENALEILPNVQYVHSMPKIELPMVQFSLKETKNLLWIFSPMAPNVRYNFFDSPEAEYALEILPNVQYAHSMWNMQYFLWREIIKKLFGCRPKIKHYARN